MGRNRVERAITIRKKKKKKTTTRNSDKNRIKLYTEYDSSLIQWKRLSKAILMRDQPSSKTILA